MGVPRYVYDRVAVDLADITPWASLAVPMLRICGLLRYTGSVQADLDHLPVSLVDASPKEVRLGVVVVVHPVLEPGLSRLAVRDACICPVPISRSCADRCCIRLVHGVDIPPRAQNIAALSGGLRPMPNTISIAVIQEAQAELAQALGHGYGGIGRRECSLVID